MPESLAAARAGAIEQLIPKPPNDVSLLRTSFATMVRKQWQQHVQPILGAVPPGCSPDQGAKVRFMAEMYARACYSMLLVSAHGPLLLRSSLRLAAQLPLSRAITVHCGRVLLSSLDPLVARSVHRQLALMATLMGVMDIALDETASAGMDAALRVASMLTAQPQPTTRPLETTLVTITRFLRAGESDWQTTYWNKVLLPATREYCAAEALALSHVQDLTGLVHRWAGLEAAVKGMWYVIAPSVGLADSFENFQRAHWNRQQKWMADASLLMQMIDDWFDQDKDRGTRSTPVIMGTWGPQSIQDLYSRTIADLDCLMEESGIHNQVFKHLFSDLYADYLHATMRAMESGLAA